MNKKLIRGLSIGFGLLVFVTLCSWGYTALVIANASMKGVYPTAEKAMIALLEQAYSPDRQIKILYAGTNSFDGSEPHVWYVIAEVRASARADGSSLNQNGCDAPGTFFLQTKDGWVHVGEGYFPTYVGVWMKVFGMAGKGQSTPSTNWASDQSPRFCQ